MNRVLVAGATGYLGSFVAKEFKSRGYFVRALARAPKKLDPIRNSLDEIVQGEITRPETLEGVCEGMDIVFSSVGITKQKDGLTFKDVDYLGNLHLLEAAKRAGVKKFVYVSVFGGPGLLHLDIVKAHEDFVATLKASGMDHTVVRPTGFFSDMEEYLRMAKKGRVYLFGSGRNRINAIHGADLAVTCANSAEGDVQEVDVGGPQVLTHREIAELSFEVLGKGPRISSVPLWMMKVAVSLAKIFNRHQGELLAFLTTAMTIDGVAPSVGTHHLEDHFRKLVSSAHTEEKGSRSC
ncbi:MAG: SDR family oxidoreductase [Gemmatimonadetes bacterium]|nr:SDR family oxidoreductase [Gemmatimonadota bacterium]NNM07359.1 SDR family oxidoreductase [Gemmatimonadota bacterium]